MRDACGNEGVALTLKSSVGDDGSSAGGGPNQHIEVQFQDTTARFYCKIYYAERFRMLRKLLFADGEDAFIRYGLGGHG